MIITALNRPPPPQTENLDAAQSWTHSADGRRNPGDTRHAVGASRGRYVFGPRSSSPSYEDDDTAETGRNPTPQSFERDPFAPGETGEDG